MRKIKFNYALGNVFTGYHFEYENDQGKVFNLNLDDNGEFIFKDINVNMPPTNYLTNTIQTPSASFNFSTDMSNFDPYSIGLIATSFPGRVTSKMMMNKEFAFPPKINGYVKNFHFITGNNISRPYSDINEIYNLYFEPEGNNEYSNHSIIDEEFQNNIFSFALSRNVDEVEKQLNSSWESIIESSLSSLYGVYFNISSNDELIDNSKISLEVNNYYFIPSGALFRVESTQAIKDHVASRQASKLYNYYTADNMWKENWNNYDGFKSYVETTYCVRANIDDGLSSIIFFGDEIYTLSSTTNVGSLNFLPVYNENNLDEVYLQLINKPKYLTLPTSKGNVNIDNMGTIRIVKDADKWRMKFDKGGAYGVILPGTFEADLNCDFNSEDKNFYMYYVDEKGNKDESPSFVIFKAIYTGYLSNNKGVSIPYLFGDERFKGGRLRYDQVGTYIKPKSKIYDESYQQSNVYLATDIASYTILI